MDALSLTEHGYRTEEKGTIFFFSNSTTKRVAMYPLILWLITTLRGMSITYFSVLFFYCRYTNIKKKRLCIITYSFLKSSSIFRGLYNLVSKIEPLSP